MSSTFGHSKPFGVSASAVCISAVAVHGETTASLKQNLLASAFLLTIFVIENYLIKRPVKRNCLLSYQGNIALTQLKHKHKKMKNIAKFRPHNLEKDMDYWLQSRSP